MLPTGTCLVLQVAAPCDNLQLACPQSGDNLNGSLLGISGPAPGIKPGSQSNEKYLMKIAYAERKKKKKDSRAFKYTAFLAISLITTLRSGVFTV